MPNKKQTECQTTFSAFCYQTTTHRNRLALSSHTASCI